MTAKQPKKVVIVGSGLTGGLLACLLGRRGIPVTMYERRPDPRRAGFIGGRSINLALSCRGLTALARVGLDKEVLEDAIRMPGRMMHSESGALTFQRYSKNEGDAINSVSRGRLNMCLLDAAEACESVELVFGHRCVDADLDAPAAIVRDETSGEEQRIECDVLIGADGAFSAVRDRMQHTDRFDFSQSYLGHGYKELVIPGADQCGIDPALHDGFAMDPAALHIWPRGKFMMIALPNADRTFTCTLFCPFEGDNSFQAISTEKDVLPFFERHFADAVTLMPTLVSDFLANPVGSMATIRCNPWNAGEKVTLIGDAAHAIVPFYGQGINSGFEDCRVLDEMLEVQGDLGSILPGFSRARKPHADAIADLALENFIEMRDSVADPVFLLRKRIEHQMHALDGDRYTPLYNLVSFSNTPYADARRSGRSVIETAARIASSIGVANGATMTESELGQRVAEMLESETAE